MGDELIYSARDVEALIGEAESRIGDIVISLTDALSTAEAERDHYLAVVNQLAGMMIDRHKLITQALHEGWRVEGDR